MESVQEPGVSPSPSPSLYSISRQALSTPAIDELPDHRCFKTPQDWVLALDPASLHTFLWRPQDGERIQLPPKEQGFPERCKCLLSDIPGAAASGCCYVLVCDLDDSQMWVCKIGTSKWDNHRYDITTSRKGGPPRVLNIGKCYGIAAVGGKISFEITSYYRGVIEFNGKDGLKIDIIEVDIYTPYSNFSW